MKNPLKPNLIPWLTLYLGLPAALCMFLLCRFGVDDRGLFIPGHFASILVWVLTAAMAVCLGLALRPLEGTSGKYSRMFPPSRMAALGILAAGLGILLTVMDSLTAVDEPVRILSGILKILAAIALGYLAWCRWNCRRGSFLAWAVVTVYMMLRLMFEYQSWSAEPELLRYCFPLLSSVCMTVAFYQRTALSVNTGSRKMYLFFTQMGAFFALAALPVTSSPIYLGLAVWGLTDLCSRKSWKHKAKAETEPPEEAQP